MSTPDEIARIVKENGQFACSITDHGTMSGVLDFQKACGKYGVKPLNGVEAYYVPSIEEDDDDKTRERFHLIVLAKNDVGLKKMFEVQERSWTKNFYYKPRIELSDIEYMAGDIVVLSGCMASQLCRLFEHGQEAEAEALASSFQAVLGRDYFIEVQPWNHGNLNNQLLALADSLSIPVVGTLDCHYPTYDDRGIEEVLLMMGQLPSLKASDDAHAKEMYREAALENDLIKKMNLLYPNRFLRFEDISPFLMSNEEVINIFKSAGVTRDDIFSNTIEVAERCTSNIKTNQYLLPKFSNQFDSDWYLEEMAWHGLQYYGLDDKQEYVDRLKEELKIIQDLRFSDYFLIVWDICSQAKGRGIAMGPGRGSVGGVLLAYCLGITKVDPVKYGLLFSRFLNPERVSPPDIDLDFADKRRKEMIDYVKDKYGEDCTASISTYGTFTPKDLIKRILSTYRVPFKDANDLSPLYNDIEEFKKLPKAKPLLDIHPTVPLVAERLLNRINENGTHPAGIVISERPLWEVIPLESRSLRDEDERLKVTAFDMNGAEEIGLWKFDFLGLNAVSVIDDCIWQIKQLHGVDVSKVSLELDDKLVIDAFNHDSLVGIFQAEGAGYKKLVAEMGIHSFNDLVASNALVRPGASVTQGAKYISRKFGREQVSYAHECLEPILSETYGTFLYQEQLMQAVVSLADFTMGEADYLRKIIGKKRDVEEFKSFEQKFIDNASKKIPIMEAVRMWDDFQKSSLYMFNKSHSVGYSMLSYQTMWLKYYYPKEFIWSCLTNEDKTENISTFLGEATKLGVEILPPDINISGDYFTLESDGIRFGISNIHGAGPSAVKEILAKRPFDSFEHFVNVVRKTAVKSTLVENLSKIGAFEGLGYDSGYDKIKYYLPILNWSKYAEADETFKDIITPIEDRGDKITYIRGLVKSTKRNPKWFRVEIEDSSGVDAFFLDDMEASIKKKDYVLGLVSGNSMFAFADPNDEESDLIKFILGGNERPFPEADKHLKKGWQIGQIISVREFTTKSGEKMATLVLWKDDDKQYKKMTCFASTWNKVAKYCNKWNWVVIDSKKDIVDNLISLEEFATMDR